MATIPCPCCGVPVPLSAISDAALLSERGRRNAARRKSFGARRKGQPVVWKNHNLCVWRCRCPECLLSSVRTLEQKLETRIATYLATIGTSPEWAVAERTLLQRRRAEIEWAILERQLDDLEATNGRAA